jgi:serine/threonine protein kinase
MSLQPSTRLGPYEIISSIGAGGMGEVYKARDKRLNRTVAVKVLSRDMAGRKCASGLSARRRAVSSLNHPHICPLSVRERWYLDFVHSG